MASFVAKRALKEVENQFLILICITFAITIHAKEVQIDQGIIRGTEETIPNTNRSYYSFKSIPYAEPPIGTLRFEDPVPPRKWEGTRDGTKEPKRCPQYVRGSSELTGNEDCLYLNVYTPEPSSESSLPVIVYIHGGLFKRGGISDYPPLPLLTKDLVLVMMHYRLGTLGFMSTGDDMPGNYGLKDQLQALQWVKENIDHFGGDPERVTLFGQSSGAINAHMLALSPKSKDLFSRVILASGNALANFAFRTDHADVANASAVHLDCSPPYSSANLKECFKNQDLESLMLLISKFTIVDDFPIVMTPRIDGDVFPDTLFNLLKKSERNIDIMTGTVRDEGAFIAIPLILNPFALDGVLKHFDTVMPILMGLDEQDNPLLLTKQINDFYMKGENISLATFDEFLQMSGDSGFNVPHEYFIRYLSGFYNEKNKCSTDNEESKFGPRIFNYEMQYKGGYAAFNFSAYPGGAELQSKYIDHADDMTYIFNPYILISPPNDDTKYSQMILDLLTNFARTGNPTPDDSFEFKWLPVNAERLDHLVLGLEPFMETNQRDEIMNFWESLQLKNNHLLLSDTEKQKCDKSNIDIDIHISINV